MLMKIAGRSLAFITLLVLCTACGSNQVRGQAPFASISSLALSGETVGATVNIRNINDVPMTVNRMTVTIRAADTVLLRHQAPATLSIDPNTTEDVLLEQTADGATIELLGELESGSRASLSFSLDGSIGTAEDGTLAFRHQGYLFRVPGRPGQFRATSTRAEEDR